MNTSEHDYFSEENSAEVVISRNAQAAGFESPYCEVVHNFVLVPKT